MTFRTRLFITFLLAGLIPIVVLAFIVRYEMTKRLTHLYEKQVAEQVEMIETDLKTRNREIGDALGKLKKDILDDNNLREAFIDRSTQNRRYLLDYASRQIELAGLSLLQIQDKKGRILSSGHFRNEYDRIERELPVLLISNSTMQDAITLIEARSPEGLFEAIARVDVFQVGSAQYFLIGGLRIDSTFISGLQRISEVSVFLRYGDQHEEGKALPASGDDLIVREVSFPYINAQRDQVTAARFVVLHNQSELVALRASVDRWFLIVGLVAGLLAVVVLTGVSTHISRPIKDLAEKTARIDLDKLDVNFHSHRKDEIGALSRLLGKMTERIRKSATLIKDAERRAAMGDLARQVNHDIKNGLTPLQNVFRHLTQLAESNPQEIPAVFEERKETVNSSIDYLQGLAANYARLTPQSERVPCDLNGMVLRLAKDIRSLGRAGVHTKLARKAEVLANPLSLRRIIENLVDNAIDSLDSKQGKVTVSTEQLSQPGEREMIRLIVADNGVGMTREQIALVFQDFYTTKEKGTGLGLSIVRRLVMDLDGNIRVESEPGQGTQFIVDLPAF